MSLANVAKRNKNSLQTPKKQASLQPRGPFKPSSHLADEWPAVFPKEILPTQPNKYGRGPLKDEFIIFQDPRSDLEAQDGLESLTWCCLLADAWAVSRELAVTLHGFRCQGSRLVKTEKGYAIKPEVGEQGWESEKEYQEARDKYLVPYREQLTRLLKNL